MDKIWTKMYEAAKERLNERRISEYVTCGEVSAAILSKSGNIYTGVCIDTCSTLGICAERNAIFNMITNGEHEIDKVLCILPDGSSGAPCGACRALLVQIMAGKYYDIEIMLDYTTGKTVRLYNRIDPACMGGVRLEYDGKQVDGTVKNRLDTIGDLLSKTVL